jgi:DNA helicase II / ATP-dependent DNA helicase PcrA
VSWYGSPHCASIEHMFVQAESLSALNDAQREAAAAEPDRPLLIVAGAGTGKTQTLTARVAWLIEQGLRPERLLLLTFTRRAAREMLSRTQAMLGARTPLAIVGGTFHSVAYRLIRRHAAALGLGDAATVIDTSDVADLIDVVREELGLPTTGRRIPRKATLADVYSRTVNLQRQLSEVLVEFYPWCQADQSEISQVMREVTARKRASQLLDYDDLLLYWQAAMKQPTVAALIASSFDHVLVDEYQDVNALQVDIVAALHRHRVGVSVVGDDMQAIYGFRAASREHILSFPATFADSQVVRLEKNYRSTPPILDLANQVAAETERSFRRTLTAVHEGGALPELVIAHDEGDEARQVVDRVLEHYERGVKLREQAVLMRAAHHSSLLELELGRRNIPFAKYGGIRHLEAAHVKDFLALVRAVLHVQDEVSWFRIFQLFDGVGPTTAKRLVAALAEPLAETSPALDALMPEETQASWRAFRASVADALRCEEAAAQARLLGRALAPLVAANYADSAPRLEDLDELVAAAAAHADLQSFVDELVLDQPQSSSEVGRPKLDEDYLVLSTIHSAKGLEWTAVHLLRATDGSIPSDMALSTSEGLEEERRLFYVALTRARRHLHLFAPRRYHYKPIGDAHGYGKLTRFLSDAAKDLVTRTEPRNEVEVAGARRAAAIVPALDHLWD